MCTALHCGLDGYDAAAYTGDCTLDEQQVSVGVNLLNLEVLGGDALITHAACHAGALEDTTRGSAGADATDAAVCGLVTVGCALACEAVAFHGASVALTLGGTGDVDEGYAFEDVDGDVLSNLVAGDVVHANLGNVAAGGNASLVEVACLSFLTLRGSISP